MVIRSQDPTYTYVHRLDHVHPIRCLYFFLRRFPFPFRARAQECPAPWPPSPSPRSSTKRCLRDAEPEPCPTASSARRDGLRQTASLFLLRALSSAPSQVSAPGRAAKPRPGRSSAPSHHLTARRRLAELSVVPSCRLGLEPESQPLISPPSLVPKPEHLQPPPLLLVPRR
jgi:hypothetical protein